MRHIDMQPLIEGMCPRCGTGLERRADGFAWCDPCNFGARLVTEGEKAILYLSNGRVGEAPLRGGTFITVNRGHAGAHGSSQ